MVVAQTCIDDFSRFTVKNLPIPWVNFTSQWDEVESRCVPSGLRWKHEYIRRMEQCQLLLAEFRIDGAILDNPSVPHCARNSKHFQDAFHRSQYGIDFRISPYLDLGPRNAGD